MSDPSPLIYCLGLEKTFQDFWLRPRVHAVKGIDLSVQPGHIHGLLGPNGSGKSTTIKMLLGLLHPSGGQAAVLGHHPRHVDNKKHIGYLPEESYLHRHMTAWETLDFYGKLFNMPGAVRHERIEDLLKMVGMSQAAHRQVGEFSKGMMRKIGLAQALINDPDLLILDEPCSGMDPIATAEVKELLRELRDCGKTILLCSHQLTDVEDLCDRITLMYGGRVQAEGKIDELLAASGHKRLDSFFLEVVRKAQADRQDTAGAQAGTGKAGFLGAGHAAAVSTQTSEAVAAPSVTEAAPPVQPTVAVDSLARKAETHGIEASAAIAPETESDPEPQTPAAAKAAESLLETPPEAPEHEAGSTDKKEDTSPSNSLIDDLLG